MKRLFKKVKIFVVGFYIYIRYFRIVIRTYAMSRSAYKRSTNKEFERRMAKSDIIDKIGEACIKMMQDDLLTFDQAVILFHAETDRHCEKINSWK